MRKAIFIKNAVILTVSSLFLRFAGIIFKVWLASAIGSEGIGLYQLVFSVYVLASTFATSGISTAVTRLTADELALGTKKGVIKIFYRCILLTLFLAVITIVILLFGARFIAEQLLSDARATLSIKILSLSLPFMGISSCIRGYFIARRNAAPTASGQIFEQIVRIVVVLLSVKAFAPYGLAYTCAAVLFGDTIAEASDCLFLYIRFLNDKKRLPKQTSSSRPPFSILRAVGHIALPITAGRYLNTGLRTIENILVPKQLSKCNLVYNNALSLFGMIKGMALPVLFFPSTLLNSFSTLLIPEISEASAKKQNGLVKSTVEQILKITAIISFIVGGIFLVAGRKIGFLIYKNNDVGFLLCALSPIVPLMYLDSISDGILKGLDQQLFSFRTAVFDSALRIVLVIFLLPRFGIYGFLGIMYFSNLLTCFLNVGRLIKVSGVKLDVLNHLAFPLSGALSISLIFNALINRLIPCGDLVYIILLSIFSIAAYIGFLFWLKIISWDEIRSVFK